jgi:hypothetical protein
MSQNQYSDDLAHIRSMMERSSRFLSLSGWAGILPGIFALAGLSLAVWFISKAQNFWWFGSDIDPSSPLTFQLMAIAMIVLGLSVFSSWYTCMRKARKENQSTWTPAIRNMLLHFAIPLSAGAIIVGWVYIKGEWGLLAPVMLAFYGLALIQVSQFTLRSVFWLGILELALTIPSGIPGFGIPMLAIGFGFAHIVYGIMMLPLNHVKGTKKN